jgi:hypothetical protein
MNNINVQQQNFEQLEWLKWKENIKAVENKASEIEPGTPESDIVINGMHEFVNNFGNNSKDKDPTNTNEQNLADAQQEKIVGKTQYGTNLDRPEDNLV